MKVEKSPKELLRLYEQAEARAEKAERLVKVCEAWIKKLESGLPCQCCKTAPATRRIWNVVNSTILGVMCDSCYDAHPFFLFPTIEQRFCRSGANDTTMRNAKKERMTK